MKSKCKGFVWIMSLLFSVLIPCTVLATTVDRIVLVPRQPDSYVGNINAVLNTKTGQTLVAWAHQSGFRTGDPHGIWGQLLGPDGKPVGSMFNILSSSYNAGGAGIIYDPDTNQFVLVFAKPVSETASEIYAVRLQPTGRRKGKFVLVSHPHNSSYEIYNERPIVVYDSENKANIIMWHRSEEGPPDPSDPKGFYGAILNSDLSVRKKPVFIQKNETGPGLLFGPHINDVKIHSSGKILLAQELDQPVTFNSEFSIAQVDKTLKNPRATITKLNEPVANGCQYGWSCFQIKLMELQGGQMATLYSRVDGIKKRILGSNGIPFSKEAKFFAEPLRSVPLKINGSAFAQSSSSTEIAVLASIPSEIDDAQFWLQLANGKGQPVGSPLLIDSGMDCVHGGIISALPASNSPGHRYAVLYAEGERDGPPLSNLGVGLVLLRVNTAP